MYFRKIVFFDFNFVYLVPRAGLEPARYRYRGILSPLCLPIEFEVNFDNFEDDLKIHNHKEELKFKDFKRGLELNFPIFRWRFKKITI